MSHDLKSAVRRRLTFCWWWWPIARLQLLPLPCSHEPLGAEDLEEGSAEVARVKGVYDGVAARVEVAEPREYGEHNVVAAFGQLRLEHAGEHVEREEGHPADNEHAHDDAESLGRLLFAREARKLPAAAHEQTALGVFFCLTRR